MNSDLQARTATNETSLAAHPQAAAEAALYGWLVLIPVHFACARRGHLTLELGQRALYYVWDIAQLFGLGAASWILIALVWRLRPATRAVAVLGVFWLTQQALLAGDLQSFAARQGGSVLVWRLAFGVATALFTLASHATGLALAGSAWRYVCAVVGVAAGAVNHWMLPLDYPGAHFILAWSAAGLIGMSLVGVVERARVPRSARAIILCLGAASLASYAVVPRAVLRTALLSTPGAVAAPFVASVWAAQRHQSGVPVPGLDPDWFTPRGIRPAIPADPMPGAPKSPIVLVLTVDALRGDLVDDRTAPREVSPNLLEMAQQTLRFEQVWSAASYTSASLRSLFLGVYYSQQSGYAAERLRRAVGQRVKLKPEASLPELLERHGVRTVNVKTLRALARSKNITDGFGEEVDLGHDPPSSEVLAALLKLLNPGVHGPLFVYAHFFDPHEPYDQGGKSGSAKQRYLAEVSLVDSAIGKLRHELRERGLDRDTYLFLSADHGEAFGEHGRDSHATTNYEEMIRVPLLIEGPGVVARRVTRPVSVIDLGPTVLSLFGVPTPGRFMGQSLVPFMRGETPVLERPLAADGDRGIRAMLFEERWKAIVNDTRGTEELYDLKEDPRELVNLAEHPEAARRFDTLRAFFSGLNPKRTERD